jgi:hypothetical protein
MKDKRISLRLNMDKYSHRKAYEVYQSIPVRERSDFIRLSMILMHDREDLINWMKENLSGIGLGLSLSQSNNRAELSKEPPSDSAANMLNFISSLNG